MNRQQIEAAPHARRGAGLFAGAVWLCLSMFVLAACGDDAPAVAKPTTNVDTAAVADAEAAVAEAMAVPSTLGLDIPLDATPEKGKTIGYMMCSDNTGCELQAKQVKRAAELVGWNAKILTYKLSEPGTLVAGLQQMLQYKPVAVGFLSVPQEVWSTVLPAYKEAGVGLMPISAYFPDPNAPALEFPIIGYTPTVEDLNHVGEILANWIIADSSGEGHVVMQSASAIPPLRVWQKAFVAKMEADCPACVVTSIEVAPADLGTPKGDAMLVTAARKDPKTGYIAASSGGFANSIPGALAAAGLQDVKTVGIAPYRNQLTMETLSSVSPAWVAVGGNLAGWWLIDAALRLDQKMDVADYHGTYAAQLITAENFDSLSDEAKAGEYLPNYDYVSEFAKLWKLDG